MIVWTIGSGESGCTDTLARAADEATAAAAAWLDTHAPTTLGWDGPTADAVTVCVDACETHLVPAYDRRGRYDPPRRPPAPRHHHRPRRHRAPRGLTGPGPP